jgi:hypothetical protein
MESENTTSYGQCTLDKEVSQYCRLSNGGTIDVSHYSYDDAKYLWDQLKAAAAGGPSTIVIGSLTASYATLTLTYSVDVKGITDMSKLRQIGAGIWWDAQIRFEKWEGSLFGGGMGMPFAANKTTFRNEDIPTTYMAYIVASHSMSKVGGFNALVAQMGGGRPTAEVDGDDDLASTHACIATGYCDSTTSRNSSIYLKAQGNTGNWYYVPYPNMQDNFPIIDPRYYSYTSCQATGWLVSC